MNIDRVDAAPALAHCDYLKNQCGMRQYVIARMAGVDRKKFSDWYLTRAATVDRDVADKILSVELPAGWSNPDLDPKIQAKRRQRHRQHIAARSGRSMRMDAQPVKDHIEMLLSLGMNRVDIDKAAGVLIGTCGKTMTRKTVARFNGEAILAVRASYTMIGLRRRLQALAADGFPADITAKVMGVAVCTILDVRIGKRPRTEFGGNIVKGYDILSGASPVKHGASVKISKYLVTQSKNLGWAPSNCWDDDTIDDPNAFPEWTGACGTGTGVWIHETRDIKVMQPDRRSGRVREFVMCHACRDYTNRRDGEKTTRTERGLPPLDRHKLRSEDRAEVLRLLDDGWSQRQVARKFDVSQQVIWRVAKSAREDAA